MGSDANFLVGPLTRLAKKCLASSGFKYLSLYTILKLKLKKDFLNYKGKTIVGFAAAILPTDFTRTV